MSDHDAYTAKPSIAIKNLDVVRMPGIRGEYRIDSLSPGINLIHGPNGIGKSRTAHALQALVWPASNSDRLFLTGNMEVAGEAWNVDLETGKATYQRNGAQVPGFTFSIPPDNHRDRYLLTLQELLQLENRNFALEIQRQASGGYDLERVRTTMGISVSDKRYRPSRSDKPLLEIRSELRDLQQHEEKLRDQERSLNQLRTEHQRSIDANNRLAELANARSYRQACGDLEAARIGLDAFEEPVKAMVGNEFERASQLLQELADKREQHREFSARVSSLTREIRETGFSGDVPSAAVISGLRNRLKDLQEQESELRRTENEMTQHIEMLSALGDRLTPGLSEEQIENLDTSGIRDLARINQQWQHVQNTLRNHQDLHEWLGDPVVSDRDVLRSGIELLTRYSQTQNVGTEGRRGKLIVVALIGAAVLIVVAAVLLATSLSQYSLLLAVAALPLLWLAFTSKSDATEAELQQIQSRYSSLNLPTPTSWTTDGVFSALQGIQGMVAKAEVEHERATRWGDLHGKRQQAVAALKEIEQQRAAYTQMYGVELAEEVPESLDSLARALDDWRRETDQFTKAKAQRSARESRRASVLSAITAELQMYGVHMDVHDSTSALVAIDELDHRITAANRAADRIRHNSERLDNDIVPQIDALEQQLAAIYDKCGLELNDQVGLKRLCEQVEPCTAARTAVHVAETAVATLRSKLRQESGDADMDLDAIDSAILLETGLANQRDRLQAEITRIETEIDGAQHQTKFESALARERDAIEVLSEGRIQDYALAADRLVFELVQTRNREVNRPSVFRIADELFISFTNGAYRLGLDEGSSEFTAVDADTGQSLALDKLSSGTRVQLLLAVRLAFIETSENGLQLPLIMDETLGNTDDIRAKAIIDSTIEIARRGRQVMYFTAQHDEIGKWSAALDSLEDPVEWNAIDLASIRGKASAKPVHSYSWDYSTFTSVSVPEGIDLESLREHLGVSTIDIQAANVLEVDLWYLMPEPQTLVALRQRGVKRWGQYLNLHKSNHLRGIWNEPQHNRALARAQIIEHFCTAWREGRPVPLTANELRESGIITNSFWDKVVTCAQQNDWDGARLVQALESGKVSGFRRNTTEALYEWLTTNGYIAQVQPLDDAVIRARVMSSVNDAIEKEIIDVHEIDELIRHLVGQPGS